MMLGPIAQRTESGHAKARADRGAVFRDSLVKTMFGTE